MRVGVWKVPFDRQCCKYEDDIKIDLQKKKKLAASSMLHEAKVAYYAFDVAARFLIWLFMPFLWLR